MQFCTDHSKDLESAFATLSLEEQKSHISPNVKTSPGSNDLEKAPQTQHFTAKPRSAVSTPKDLAQVELSLSAQELSNLLVALRKLREALLATSSTAPSPVFAQRVHIFGIRLAILASHPTSYHPPLLHLLSVLHTKKYPLPATEVSEMTTYLILDLVCRQQDFSGAIALRSRSKQLRGYDSRVVDEIISAVLTENWVAFWRVRRKVDGYVRALMQWHVPLLRRNTLKAFGRAYMNCEADWILQSATGGEMVWDELAAKESVGWAVEGSKVVIRKPKPPPKT